MASSFSKDVNAFTLNFAKASDDTVRATAIKTWAAIIKESPVDSGRFRGNWLATGKEPSSRTTSSEDTSKDGIDTASKAAKVVISIKDASTFTLTNNLPYSDVIEYGGYKEGPNTSGGYSKQAPEGVVRVNIGRARRLIEEESRKRYRKL